MQQSWFHDHSLLWRFAGTEQWTLPQDCRDHTKHREMPTGRVYGKDNFPAANTVKKTQLQFASWNELTCFLCSFDDRSISHHAQRQRKDRLIPRALPRLKSSEHLPLRSCLSHFGMRQNYPSLQTETWRMFSTAEFPSPRLIDKGKVISKIGLRSISIRDIQQ